MTHTTKLLALFVLTTLAFNAFAADDFDLNAAVEAGKVKPTRWRHPLDLPKPRHAVPRAVAPFMARQVAMPGVPVRRPLDKEDSTRVCVLVNASIRSAIDAALTQYITDLTYAGFTPFVVESSGGTAEDLRALLIGYYGEPESLAGAVLIGDFPYIIYEMMQDWDAGGPDPPEYEDFPCDLFYMDLDGIWEDSLTDGDVLPDNGKSLPCLPEVLPSSQSGYQPETEGDQEGARLLDHCYHRPLPTDVAQGPQRRLPRRGGYNYSGKQPEMAEAKGGRIPRRSQ